MVPHRFGAIGTAGQMHVHDKLEIFHRHFVKAFVAQYAGIVDENVDMAPFGDRVGDHFLNRRHVGDAATSGHGFAAFGFDFGNHLFGDRGGATGAIAGSAKIVDDDLDAASRQFLGMLATQTSTSAGDDGNAVVKFYCAHGESFFN